MENYIVSARKYRPSTFSSVVGQKALTATLRNAIATGRLAHAYLFCGSRGVGKTSCARIFAKTINCSHPTPEGDPCNECDSCRQFNENRSLNILELDAASNNSVDDIRSLVEQVQVPPTNGRYRVFIVDEVHMLSSAAFNAFLKTLEEPPSYVVFILATTEKQKIIPTILSRCQIYDFNRITISDMVDHLAYVAQQEGIAAERSALSVIASKADGAMRDALSIFDQVAASSRGNITYQSAIDNLNVLDEAYYTRLMEAFLADDVPTALNIYKEIRDRGFDSQFFVNGISQFIRDLMVARDPQTIGLLDADEAVKQRMAALAAKASPEFFYSAMSLCNEADLAYRNSSNKIFLVELLLIRLCQLSGPSPIFDGSGEGLIRKIEPRQAAPQPSPSATSSAGQAPSAGSAPRTAQPAASSAVQPTATAAQPTAAPKPAAPAASRSASATSARPAAHGSTRMPLFSLKEQLAPEKPQETVAAEAAAPLRDRPYEEADVEKAWDAFIAARPKEHILVNTMKASRPQRRDAHLFSVTVENAVQAQLMEETMPQLLGHLRDAIGNDHFGLSVEVNQGEGSPLAWNDREFLGHLMESHPQLANFVREFKLNLT